MEVRGKIGWSTAKMGGITVFNNEIEILSDFDNQTK